MIDVTVINAAAIISGVADAPRRIKVAVSSALEHAAEMFRDDIAEHTPRKTGASAESVYSRQRDQLTYEVGYPAAVAWKMRIVELYGARPHAIFPRGRAGSKESRALGAHLRRHGALFPGATTISAVTSAWTQFNRGALSKIANSRRLLARALRASGIDPEKIAALTGKGGGLHTAALALHFGGRFAAFAEHPGIHPRHTLQNRLGVMVPQILGLVDTAVAAALEARS